MADERPEDIEPSQDSGRPKRAPPTIDLTASEVTGGTAEPVGEAAGEAGTTADETPRNPPPPTPRTAATLVSAITGAVAAALLLAIAWFAGWPGQTVAPPVVAQVDTAAV